MTEDRLDENTPTSPDPAPSKPHGDPFAEESGSHPGRPPQDAEDRAAEDDAPAA